MRYTTLLTRGTATGTIKRTDMPRRRPDLQFQLPVEKEIGTREQNNLYGNCRSDSEGLCVMRSNSRLRSEWDAPQIKFPRRGRIVVADRPHRSRSS